MDNVGVPNGCLLSETGAEKVAWLPFYLIIVLYFFTEVLFQVWYKILPQF